ncbi:MAG: leucine-rich repeat protein [Prevotella sp.]|nr:leucine-rich repeat protein [Prevotella sp.]
MKQKLHLFSLLLLAVALLAPAKAMAQVVIGNFTYTFSGNEATVTASSLTSGDIVIPETVVYGGNTYNVTALSYDNTLFKGSPTSITGNSIKSITGGDDGLSLSFYPHKMKLCDRFKNCASINFPHLVSLKKCVFLIDNNALTTLSLPELETIEQCAYFLSDCSLLSSVSLPKLKKISAYQSFYRLPALTTLSLPELTEISNCRRTIQENSALVSLSLPKLQIIKGEFCIHLLDALQTLYIPELTEIVDGSNCISSLKKLYTLNAPKLQKIDHRRPFDESAFRVVNLADGCEINADGMLGGSYASSITVNGATKITDENFAYYSSILKHISLPDVVEFKGSVGEGCDAMESFSAPKLKKLNNSGLFTQGSCPNLTTVDIHNLEEVTGSRLFDNSPITSLTLRGDLKADAASTMTLSAYPTVVTVTDQSAVSDIPASFFAGVKGGRFIAPKGKAGMYATKWNLNTAKTMVYSPVEINKSTASTLYASGSITKADASFTYGGTTYKNQYDISHAMTAAECLDPSVLSDNDLGFTPTLTTQTVQNGNNALAGYSFYYASAYNDAPTRKLGDLTLTALPTTAVSTLQGFNATATSLNQGIGRDLGGFLFKGNNASVTEVYLPYTPTATTVTTNYLKAGEGNRVQTRQNNSHEFYWHPGDASFTMGFYESYNVLIPEYRSYLSIAKTLTSNAKRFNLIFEDGQTTGISTVNMSADDNSATLSDVWYTLQGTRLPVKPTAAGIYINGGRKVVIK